MKLHTLARTASTKEKLLAHTKYPPAALFLVLEAGILPVASQVLSQKPRRKSKKWCVTLRVCGRIDSTGGEPRRAGLGFDSQNLPLGQRRWLRRKSCTLLKGTQHLSGDEKSGDPHLKTSEQSGDKPKSHSVTRYEEVAAERVTLVSLFPAHV